MSHRAVGALVAGLVLLAAAPAGADDDPYADAPPRAPSASAQPVQPPASAPPPAQSSPPAPSATPSASPVPAPGVCTPPPEPYDPYANLPQINAPPPWAVAKQREKLYAEGRELVKNGRWKEALDKLREVNKIRSEPRVLLWMGFPAEQLGCLVEAKQLYTQAKNDAERLKLKQEQQDAEAALAALDPHIPRLVIHLPEEPGAVVAIDSKGVTLDGDQWEVNPGKHQVMVAWPKRLPFQQEVDAQFGQPTVVNVTVPALPAPPSPPPPPPPPVRPRPTGCGCPTRDTSDPYGAATPLTVVGLGAALVAARRRRR